MREYFFANYRLLMDDRIANHESSKKRLADFAAPMPYTHTFTLRLGDAKELEERRERALNCPVAYDADIYTIHDIDGGRAFVSTLKYEHPRMGGLRNVILCSQDYGDMTVWVTDRFFEIERNGQEPFIPRLIPIFATFEAGIVMRDGLPIHASLVEKDGFGVVFLGPCGRGKSTQAKLWEKYLGADFIIGDRPVLRKLGGKWLGFGMPWDGPDMLYRQISVPVRALVYLEKAKENSISPMNTVQAMPKLLQQARMPVWDDTAVDGAVALMGELAWEVPVYRLQCLPDEAAARLTYETIYKR